jgi:hypothetical protein
MRFEETQFPDWRVCALMLVALAGLLVWRHAPRLPAYVAMILVTAGFLECRLSTYVDEQAVRIDFGLIPVYSRVIALADIVWVGVEVSAPTSAQPSSRASTPAPASAPASASAPAPASVSPLAATAPANSPPVSLQHAPLAGSPATGSWGWGVRRDRDGTFAIAIRGTQSVLLILRDGSRLRIGSQEPGALEQALRQALPTAVPSARCPASAC